MYRIIVAALLAPSMLIAQLGGSAPAGNTSTTTQLPLSGRAAQSGSVTAAQTPLPGTTTSVNTLNTTIQVNGPYAGSSSSVGHTPFAGKLSLSGALQRGISYNLGAVGLSAA